MVKFLGPFFSKPILKEEVIPDFSMFAELEKLFANIAPGSVVRGAIYMWNQDGGLNKKGFRDKWVDVLGNPRRITDQFLQKATACDTKLILDHYIVESHTKTLASLREAIGSDSVYIDPRTGANDPEFRKELYKKQKFAQTGYMHDKFFLISEVIGLGKYVVVQMTANINITQCHQFNNMLVIYDDQPLFEKYLKHWDNLKDNIIKRNEYRLLGLKTKEKLTNILAEDYLDLSSEVAAFFFPRQKCPIEQELRRLLAEDERVKIDMAMAYLTRRGFMKLLLELRRSRKRVRIIMSEEDQNSGAIEAFKGTGVHFKILKNKKYNRESYVAEDGSKVTKDNWQARMHHKFILIKNEDKRITWTGSYNITYPGLRLNDEAVLRITDPSVYRQYKKTFNMLWGGDILI